MTIFIPLYINNATTINLTSLPIKIQNATALKLTLKKPKLKVNISPINGSQLKKAKKLPYLSILYLSEYTFSFFILKIFSIFFQSPKYPKKYVVILPKKFPKVATIILIHNLNPL